ncbi:patatin-like phospholipase family protein [Proteiniphilum sp.]|uniref:patatin-like phospholipase family protein n=1 Tax=Proteiniphilum sp. TaxID=1926877 RepID=UPI002B21F01C|nr:patatin-like phospholipase family protein [Proteiniphilum sp.]MEA4916908.1 patatin-like phospholipase family protein [Proteiniphilum sp.]
MKATNNRSTYNLGFVLSGGGARGFAHLGAIQALLEKGIVPDIISGTSAGALAGAFLADGYMPEEILEIFSHRSVREFTGFSISRAGLFNTNKMIEFLKKHLRARTFEDLRITLHVTATDFERGVCHDFHEGPLLAPLAASCSIPIIFSPTVVAGRQYVDGGLLKNLPASIIRDQCEEIIGISLNPIYMDKYKDSFKGVAEKSFHCILNSNTGADKPLCDILIEPENIHKYSMFDVQYAKVIYNAGYKTVRIYFANKAG